MKYKPHIKMMRIFIAVKINADDTLITMMSDLKAGLKEEKIKWTDSENLHITLAFLGDTEEDMIKPVNKMLKRICEGFGEFEIIIKGADVDRSVRFNGRGAAHIAPGRELPLFGSVAVEGADIVVV